MRQTLSVFVISYNRAALLESCLRAASFADELIVIDKSSTDDSVAVAARYADRVEIVPWSPTVEETRAFAASLCRHEWILFLDDDEILSPETERYLTHQIEWRDIDIYAIPYRHYILGLHDEQAYYWPEVRHCLFRAGAIEFIPTVHGGTILQSDRIAAVPPESGVAIHHLSHPSVSSWIERTNRYTDRPDRVRVPAEENDLARFAHARIDYWVQRTVDRTPHGYPVAVALLRAIYDMVDRLKTWEIERGQDGDAMFRIAQTRLTAGLGGQNRRTERFCHDYPAPASGGIGGSDVQSIGSEFTLGEARPSSGEARHGDSIAVLVQLRGLEAQLRERTEAARKSDQRLSESCRTLQATRAELEDVRENLAGCRMALADSEANFSRLQSEFVETQALLSNVRQDAERLSGSVRLFIRQYLPKLRRHIARLTGLWRPASDAMD